MSGWGDTALRIAQENPDVQVHDTPTYEEMRGATRPMPSSRLEQRFMALWELADCPPLEREYRFDEVRRWRFDFAHPVSMVAIEIEGGTYSGGRHTRHEGYTADCEKYNYAQMGGWQVYRLTASMITPEWCERIADAIRTTEAMKCI